MRVPASSRLRSCHQLFAAVLLFAALAVLAGCASTPQVVEPTPAPAAEPEIPPLTVEERNALLEQAGSQVLLAREQARMGLAEDASESCDRAAALLRPFAGRDGEIATRLGEILEEREGLLLQAEALVFRFEESFSESPDEEAELLAGPALEIDPSHIGEVEQAAQNVSPDWPVDLNEQVLAWIEVYRDGGKLGSYMKQSIARSGQYEQRFREIFAEEGIPSDLMYLAHVESGFKTSAYSRARARGIFQFISATGRRYGMRVDWWVDERADPEKSCRASATYLRDLYDEFGDWKLALAGYNAGEGRVRRSIRKAGTNDFWELRRRRFFRRETRNYVPAIMAATIVSKDPARFGHGDAIKTQPVPFELVLVPDQADLEVLARAASVTVKDLKQLNPALRRGQSPPKYPNYPLKVPAGKAEGFAEKLAQIPRSEWIVKQLHRVRRGETLSGISRRYGTSVRAIQQANSMGRRTMLSIGRVLEIPKGPGPARSYKQAPVRVAGDGSYRVRRGDTLDRIARRQGVRVAQLQAWNGMGRSTRIKVGEKLYVSKPGTAAAKASKAKSKSQPTPAAGGKTHKVRRGESAWTISQHYRVTLSALLRANGLHKRSVLQPGQRLTIPSRSAPPKGVAKAAPARSGDGVHVVRSGDSLYKIARRYGVTVEKLRTINNLAPGAVIHPGDRLSVQ